MPTYDYRCEACSHTFDAFQRMSDEPLVECPDCGEQSLRRLIGSGAGIIFKGSGFYETDYRGDSYAQDAKKDAEASEPESSGSKDDANKSSGDASKGDD